MADDASPINEPSRAVVVRERLIANAPVAIWDTTDFEHMGRVAATMAESGLMSDTFLKDGDGEASPKAVVARCLLVASVARECGANPLIFLQHCSIIGRKLHMEGKLVNAIVRARTGVELKFRFGLWDKDHIVFPPQREDGSDDESFLHGAGERLAIRAWDPERPERYVEGSAGMWKTDRKGSPWASVNNYPRQLRYRAAPEWARAFEPGAILGINVDGEDDGDDFTFVRPARERVDLVGKLGAISGEGFDEERINGEVGPGTPENSQEAVRPTSTAEATATAGAPPVEKEPATSARAAPASTAGQATSSGPQSSGPVEGYPLADEVYHLEGEEAGENGKRPTYKNGQAFSSAGPKAKLKTYADHHPDFQDGPAPGTEASEAEEAEAEDAEFEEVQAADEVTQPEVDAEAQDEEPEEQGEEDEYADLTPAFATYARATDKATTFDEVKVAMRDFWATEEFKGFSPGQQNQIRKNTWEALQERGVKCPDPAADASAFRLWIEAQEDPDAVAGTLAVLEKSGVAENALAVCRTAAAEVIKDLRAG